jgi:hopanoid-associated phosphorylase
MNGTLLVVTGLQKEARSAQGAGITTLCSGGDSERLRGILAASDPRRHWGVISFGIAGGLDPALRPGDILVGTSVQYDGDVHCAQNELSAALTANLLRRHSVVGSGGFIGSDSAVICVDEKAALRAQTGASAVDMESHVVAEWAKRHDLPFAILRVVSDPAERALPPLAARALTPDGRIDVSRVMMGLARKPRQLSALAKAGRDARVAFAALGRCRGLLGPFPGLGLAHL